jgi:hypothetical protein
MLSIFFRSFFFSSLPASSFDDALVEVFDLEPDEEAMVYGLKWNPDVEGVILADCVVFVLLINVALDMMGATLELFMLNFFVVTVAGGGEEEASSSSGTSSEEFWDFDGIV